jgi:hypothetical protein
VADLKTQWKKKGKEELHSFFQNIKQERGERYNALKDTRGHAQLRGSARSK